MADTKSNSLPRRNRVAIGETLAVLFCPHSNGKLFGVTIDLEDLERVQAVGFWRVSNFRKWIGKVGLYCYAIKDNKNVYLHRFITGAQPGQIVDHKNRRTLDNRKSEIRITTQAVNQLNRVYGGHGKSGIRGAKQTRSGRFAAVVAIQGRKRQLGTFDTPEMAGQVVREFLLSAGVTL